MISHRNVISNIIQISTYEDTSRTIVNGKKRQDVVLGLLPFSHIYGLVVIAQAGTWRGDGCVVLPKFEMQQFLNAIVKNKINTLYLVSPSCLVFRI